MTTMKPELTPDSPARGSPAPPRRGLWLLVAGCLGVMLIGFLLIGGRGRQKTLATTQPPSASASNTRWPARKRSHATPPYSRPPSAKSAADIVADKLRQFVIDRRALVRAWARRLRVQVPVAVERFFDAAETGRWDAIEDQFQALKAAQRNGQDVEAQTLTKLWPALAETHGVAQATHLWPAQALLDYGTAVLDALRPGMVYLGGTDAGRFIPTLLNDTADGERHVVLTQNAFADVSYLDYVNFRYPDRLALLTSDDSQQAFQDYLADARTRAEHDQQFPNDPSALRPGEDVRLIPNPDGSQRTQVSGQVAVMAINERLLQTLLAKNPDVPFALEESYPLPSTYAGAAPLGPIMELRAYDQANALGAEGAAPELNYWRTTARDLLADPATAGSAEVLNAYSKMAAGQAALLTDHHAFSDAEQLYAVATDIAPANAEAVFRYATLLVQENRSAAAVAVAERAVSADPQNAQLVSLLTSLRSSNKP